MTAGSSMVAISSIRPAQRGQQGGRRRPAERPPPEGASVAYTQEVLALLRTAKGLLAPDGLLFLLDPLFAPGQSRAARFLVSKDRG